MAAVSKKEYLKRYLSNADSGEKKKRRKKVKAAVKTGSSCIIDDDVNLADIKVKNDSETRESLLDVGDETPLIFNETGTTVLSKDLESIKKQQEERKSMWAPLRNTQSEVYMQNNEQQRKNLKKRHDSISPERISANEELGKTLKGQKNSVGTSSRQERHDSEDMLSRQLARHDSSSDQSPPRQVTPKETHTKRLSPDFSPRRAGGKAYTSSSVDQSPPRRSRHDSSSDQSPPRKQHSAKIASIRARHDSPDISPPRKAEKSRVRSSAKNRHDSSSDQSPPRNRQSSRNSVKNSRHASPDLSPLRKGGSERIVSGSKSRYNRSGIEPRRIRHGSPDLSPRRATNNRSASPDVSRLKRQTSADIVDPSLRRRRHDSPDLSPRRRHDSPDLSPRRKSARVPSPDLSLPRGGRGGKRSANDSDQSPPRKQKISERKAGLHSASELRRENERTRQRENEMFARMSSSTTGKGMETIHRDKSGRKRDFKIEEEKKREEEKLKEKENAIFREWGKGVKQSKSAKEKVDDDLYEMSKPLARYENDKDLDQMLKEKDRAGDPMLAFMQKKKTRQDVVAGKKEKPKYRGPAPPPNRFNIQPGYRWDGVDRSNGFEKKRFAMLANKGSTRDEAYKWSTEDM